MLFYIPVYALTKVRVGTYTRLHVNLHAACSILAYAFGFYPRRFTISLWSTLQTSVYPYTSLTKTGVAEMKRNRVGAGLWTFSPRAAEGQGERAQMAGRGIVFKYRPPANSGRRASQL
jgi:hypothetical protein